MLAGVLQSSSPGDAGCRNANTVALAPTSLDGVSATVCLGRSGNRKCDSAGISTSAPSMFHTNMNVSRMPMSAWNLIGDKAQVTTPAASVDAGQRDDLAGELQRALVGARQRHARALLRELHAQQVQRVVDADADAERDDRQRRDLHADAQPHHQRLAQDRGEHQRQHRDDHRAPAAEGDEAQQR